MSHPVLIFYEFNQYPGVYQFSDVTVVSLFPGLPSDTNVVTPNTECSWDFTTKTRSTNDDGTSLDLEWEDEEGESRMFAQTGKLPFFFIILIELHKVRALLCTPNQSAGYFSAKTDSVFSGTAEKKRRMRRGRPHLYQPSSGVPLNCINNRSETSQARP